MGDEDAVGECAYESVALLGESDCDACVSGSRGKGREDEQAPILEGRLEFGLQSHPYDAPRRNPDYGLSATEQDSKALPFHCGVETAHENLALVPHLDDRVKGLENYGAGTLRGTKETDDRFCNYVDRAVRPQHCSRLYEFARSQPCWITGRPDLDSGETFHRAPYSSFASPLILYLMS